MDPGVWLAPISKEDKENNMVPESIEEVEQRVAAMPRWKQYTLVCIVLLILVYLAWTIWGHRPPVHSDGFQPGKPAVDSEKVDGPPLKKPIKVVPKKPVTEKFPNAPIKPSEEWVNTTDVDEAPNGATVLTKIDTETGEVSDVVQMKPAPWFAFERRNTIGVGYEVGTQGAKIPVYYRRDLVRVKDVHLVGEVGGKIALDPAEKSEAHGAAILEYRW